MGDGAAYLMHLLEVAALLDREGCPDPSIVDEEECKDDVRERVRAGSERAAFLYVADKVSKVREIRFLMASDPDQPEIELRIARYQKSLAMLEEKLPGNRTVMLLRFEIESLDQLPPDLRDDD